MIVTSHILKKNIDQSNQRWALYDLIGWMHLKFRVFVNPRFERACVWLSHKVLCIHVSIATVWEFMCTPDMGNIREQEKKWRNEEIKKWKLLRLSSLDKKSM